MVRYGSGSDLGLAERAVQPTPGRSRPAPSRCLSQSRVVRFSRKHPRQRL